MSNPPPIKMRTAPGDLVEDVPQRVQDRMREHDDDLAPTGATVNVDLFGIWPKIAVAALVGYALGFAIHGRS